MKKYLNKPTMAVCAIIAVLLIFALLPIGCANSKPRPMPSQESVDSLMQTFAKLEHAFGLCIIVGCPTRTGPANPYSLKEAKAQIAQGKEDLAFLHGIKSAKIFEDVKAQANSYRQSPTQNNSDKLFEVLEACVASVKSDLQVPLWQERVTPIYSHKTEIYVEYLAYQVAELSSGNALMPANDTPKKPRSTLPKEAVRDVVNTFKSLDHTLRLCMIDAKAPIPDRTKKYSREEAQKMLDLTLKEKKFLEGLRFASTMGDLADAFNSYFSSPSPTTSDKLLGLLEKFIGDVKKDCQSSLWKEMVSLVHTELVKGYVSTLEQLFNQMTTGE